MATAGIKKQITRGKKYKLLKKKPDQKWQYEFDEVQNVLHNLSNSFQSVFFLAHQNYVVQSKFGRCSVNAVQYEQGGSNVLIH